MAEINCIINIANQQGTYFLAEDSGNFIAPGNISLNRGLNLIPASRQPSVTSPDGSILDISGTSSGFTARIPASGSPKLLSFQYAISTYRTSPGGIYTSFLLPAYYQYKICPQPTCVREFSGIATVPLSVNIKDTPTSVSCNSPPINATPGGGPFEVNVICTISGGNSTKLSPSSQTLFSPGTIILSKGQSALSATLQPIISSPDGSLSNISGTASGGFTANINSLPAQLQVKYKGTTANTTPAGTYTSTPVSFIWSTL